MALPYSEVFLGLLLAYVAYSVWAHLDGRYPIVGALALLVATAVVDAAGATGTANTLAEYVFFLLAAGVFLLLAEQVRERSGSHARPVLSVPSEPVPSDPPDPAERSTEEPLDGLEKEPVPLIDTAGHEDQHQEEGGDPEPQRG